MAVYLCSAHNYEIKNFIIRNKMKNLILLLFISLIFAGCGEKKVNQTPEAAKQQTGNSSIVKDNAPPKQVNLSYKLLAGQHFSYQLINGNSSSQTLVTDSARTQKMEQTITYKIDMNVEGVEDNVMDIKINISSVKVDAEMGGRRITYHSGGNLDSARKLGLIDMETLANSPFNIRLNPDGDIAEFYKVDKLINKFLDMQNIKKDTVTSDQKKQVQYNIVEGALRPLLSQVFRKLPGKTLGLDSSWVVTYPSQVPPFELTNKAQFKVVDFNLLGIDKLVAIDASLSVTSKGQNKVSNRGINYNFKNPESSGGGKIYFNISRGLIQQSKTNTSLKISADMTIPSSPKGPMKAKNSSSVMNSYEVQLL
jgi:uncharacterized protein (UPF0333 family)